MLEMLPGISLHQVRSALGAWLLLQGLQHPLHMAVQVAHGGGAVHLPSPVDEVIDDGLPAAVLVLYRAGDGGGGAVLGI